MALHEIVESKFGGFAESGDRMYMRTYTGRYAVESLEDWREMRLSASMHGTCSCPFGGIVRGFLDAAVGDGDYRPAVAAGRGLDAHERHQVLRLLDAWIKAAQDGYRPAESVARAMRTAWVGKWGDKPPRAVVRA